VVREVASRAKRWKPRWRPAGRLRRRGGARGWRRGRRAGARRGGTYGRRGEASLCAPVSSVAARGAWESPMVATQGDVERGHWRIISIFWKLQGRPRHGRRGTDRGTGGVGGTGWSSCRQKLVQRSNRSGYDIIVSSARNSRSAGVLGPRCSAKGKAISSKMTCREMMMTLDDRSRQRYPLW